MTEQSSLQKLPLQETNCLDSHATGLLLVEEATQRIAAAVSPVTTVEKLAVRDTLNRVLAQTIISPMNVPAHTNSAMDGYACRAADIAPTTQQVLTLKVVGSVMAGAPIARTIGAGECARIMTGGKMPTGTDTVIMQEHVSVEGDGIVVNKVVQAGQNVRQVGEDIAKDQSVMMTGHLIGTADLGLLASLGIAEVAVLRRLRVAFFSTGDELCSVGQPLEEGQIYDSNRYTLYAMLKQFGVDILDMGVVRDDKTQLREAYLQAAEFADVLITSGGVSVGEADYGQTVLEEVGEINFWKIAMKPGRPLLFGNINRCKVFGLPGNPVSAMVTFYQFVLPALRKLAGQPVSAPLRFPLKCTTPIKKLPGRMEFQRGIIETDAKGESIVRSTGQQGSGILSSMSRANCFIILSLKCGNLPADSIVQVQPFEGRI